MSEKLSPLEKRRLRMKNTGKLLLISLFSCCILVFVIGKVWEKTREREKQSAKYRTTQSLDAATRLAAIKTITPFVIRGQFSLTNGSTLIVDSEMGYEMTLPPDWQVIPIDVEQFNKWSESFIEDRPHAAELIWSTREFIQEELILEAIYFDPAQSDDEYSPYLNLFFNEMPGTKNIHLESFITMSLEIYGGIIPDFTFYQLESKRNFNGVDYCEVMVDFNALEENVIEIRGLFIYIKVEKGLMGIFLGALLPDYPAFVDTFDEIINSFKLRDY